MVAATALVGAQIVLGGWVSTNYAVLACTTFPTCQGSWWPEMNFAQGFQIWRELGMLQDGTHISFAGLTAIHYVHRLMAYLVLAVINELVWRTQPEAKWVTYNTWGDVAINMIFWVVNIALLAKHLTDEDGVPLGEKDGPT